MTSHRTNVLFAWSNQPAHCLLPLQDPKHNVEEKTGSEIERDLEARSKVHLKKNIGFCDTKQTNAHSSMPFQGEKVGDIRVRTYLPTYQREKRKKSGWKSRCSDCHCSQSVSQSVISSFAMSFVEAGWQRENYARKEKKKEPARKFDKRKEACDCEKRKYGEGKAWLVRRARKIGLPHLRSSSSSSFYFTWKSPIGLFIILEPRDQEIGEFYVVQEHCPTDFEAQ